MALGCYVICTTCKRIQVRGLYGGHECPFHGYTLVYATMEEIRAAFYEAVRTGNRAYADFLAEAL